MFIETIREMYTVKRAFVTRDEGISSYDAAEKFKALVPDADILMMHWHEDHITIEYKIEA